MLVYGACPTKGEQSESRTVQNRGCMYTSIEPMDIGSRMVW